MKTIEERIQEAYKQHPRADGKQILKVVGCKDTPRFWQALADVQNKLRGYSVSQRKNHNAHPKRLPGA